MPMLKNNPMLWLVFAVFFLAGCPSDGEISVTSLDEPTTPAEPVDPVLPTSMEDCEASDAIFAGQQPARLMSRYEYDNTIRDLLGVEGSFAKDNFPPENAENGFENNTGSHAVNLSTVRAMMEQAEDLAAHAVSQNAESVIGCDTSSASCGQKFVESFVRRAFRRPPTDEELQTFNDLFETVEDSEGFDTAAEMTIEAVLLSPQFLYRIEFSDNDAPGSVVQVGPYEMASRLSYFLWATMPDDELMRAAANDELSTDDEVRAQVERMLDDPRSTSMIEHFYRQWLHFDAIDTMVKDPDLYPDWNESVTEGWRASLNAFIEHVHRDGGDVETLLSSRTVFMDDRIAPLYGVSAGETMQPVDMDAAERAGLLTQPALMALLAYPDQSSPIHRGIFVREQLLCQKLPAPPDDIQIDPPDPDTTATTREIFRQHSEDPSCAGCHLLIDPIGMGFENYDSIGRYRTVERDQDVDGTGNLANTADPSIGGDFDGAVELANMLADAREVQDCIADQWITFALGRAETQADMCSADFVREEFAASGGTFKDLLTAIAVSDTFRYRTVQVQPETDEVGDR